MFRQLKKPVATLIAAMTIGQVAPAFADSADTLPDMGTSAGARFPLVRKCRWATIMSASYAAAPLINDPLLTQYINSLGMRLVSHANSVKTPFHFFRSTTTKLTPLLSLAATWCCTLPCSVIPITKVNWLQLWRTKSPTSPNVTWRERWKISSAARR